MDSTKALIEAAIAKHDPRRAGIKTDGAIPMWIVGQAYDEFVADLRAALFAQGEAAQPAAGAWVDWPGLKQPVDDDTIIEFLADDGVIERRLARYMRWELPFKYRLPASPAASQDGGRDQ